MSVLLSALLGILACGGPSGDTAAAEAAPDDSAAPPTCDAAALPSIEAPITATVLAYDPDAGCWEQADVALDPTWWSAYDASDTGAPPCNDIELMVPRVDCACLLFAAQCGEGPIRDDPAVAFTAEAAERCAALRESAPSCG